MSHERKLYTERLRLSTLGRFTTPSQAGREIEAMNETYELMRLCQVPGGWAHYWRKNPAMSAWYPSGKPAMIPAPWLESDLYFSVNAATGDNPRGTAFRVRNAHIGNVSVIYCDVDANGAEMPLQPSIVVNSGRGEHRYWLLDTPIDASIAADLQRAWVHRCGADPAAVDLARVLRVPGSVNTKNGARVAVIRWEPGRRYSAQRMLSECGDASPPAVRAYEMPVPTETPEVTPLIERIRRSRQGHEFERLYNGQHTYESGSEADAALLRLVSWWVQGDTAQMLSIWRSSALWREARCNDDYVARTLQHGLSGNRTQQRVMA